MKGQSPWELLGGLSGFLFPRCRGLRSCVESVLEPEHSSPVLTWILGYFWSLPRGVSPRLEWGHARALSSRAVAAVSLPVASQEEALSIGKTRGTPGSSLHSQSPPDVSVHSRDTCFPALPRLSRRGSTHTKVARGTALWESLVGKPRGKATDPFIHAKGSMTLLLQLGRKVHVHAPTRHED